MRNHASRWKNNQGLCDVAIYAILADDYCFYINAAFSIRLHMMYWVYN